MKKTFKILGIIIIILIVIVAIYFALKQSKINLGQKTDVPETMLENQSEEAAKATQELIDEALKDQGINLNETGNASSTEGAVETPKAIAVTPGTSLIDLQTGQVVNEEGLVMDNTAGSGDPDAPHVSVPLDETDVPNAAIKLDVKQDGFNPTEFSVNAGQAVALVITNVGQWTEIFRFEEESLSGVAIGLAPGETRSITFNAPKAGEYIFFSDMANHRATGAVGKMIVK